MTNPNKGLIVGLIVMLAECPTTARMHVRVFPDTKRLLSLWYSVGIYSFTKVYLISNYKYFSRELKTHAY